MTTLQVQGKLGAYAEAWDDLVERSPLPSPFLRSWWLSAMPAPDPEFVLVVDAGHLLGGLALQVTTIGPTKIRRLLGCGALLPDHLDIVAATDRVDDVVAELARWLRLQRRTIFDFEGVGDQSLLVRAVPPTAKTRPVGEAPFVELPASMDELLARRGKAARKSLRRQASRLESEGSRYRVHEGPTAEAFAALGEVRALHSIRWGPASGFLGAFDTFEEAARAGLARGDVSVHQLTTDDQVVATEVTFRTAGRVTAYQTGRRIEPRWSGVGTVLQLEVIRWAIAHGCTEYDMLRGVEAYKRHWLTSTRPVLRLRSASGVSAHLVLIAMETRVRAGAGKGWARRRSQQAREAAGGGHVPPRRLRQ